MALAWGGVRRWGAAAGCDYMRRLTVVCGTDWDGDVRLFPPRGCCCQRVAGAEEKGGGNRVVDSNNIRKMEI